MSRLYFDYNASAPLVSGLKEKIMELMEADYKNPSSVHQDGQSARALIEKSRRTVLQLLGAKKDDKLIFTSGGTEGNNTVLETAYQNRGDKNQLLLTKIEHSCVYNYAKALEKKGIELVWIEVNRQGEIEWDDFLNKLKPQVFFVTAMLSNNETGFILPIKKMAEAAHQKGIPFHTDAVCAMGKWPINFQDLGVDFFTFSSHKFGGLKGVGGIVHKKEVNISPYILGGTHENSKRAGTENFFGVVSTAFALEQQVKNLPVELERQQVLREKLKEGIQNIYHKVIFIESKENLPQTLSASFSGLNGNLLLTNLDLEGVSASYGSACASGSLEISRIMRELKLSLNESRSAIRFSFGKTTSEADVEDLLQRLERAIGRMG